MPASPHARSGHGPVRPGCCRRRWRRSRPPARRRPAPRPALPRFRLAQAPGPSAPEHRHAVSSSFDCSRWSGRLSGGDYTVSVACRMKNSAPQEAEGPQRIAKLLARAGLCSRRDAERWIAEGRVSIDGATLTTPAVTVSAGQEVRVDRSEEHTSELQSHSFISYAVFCLKKKNNHPTHAVTRPTSAAPEPSAPNVEG